ncbi:MAG: hypothetical protein IT464_12750 [Planctomycetes bacterium]|nr:hypothetical protein [Planctomycetota bacterium]
MASFNTLRRRLGAAIVAALKSGNAIIDEVLAGSGATLNVELADFAHDDAEATRQPGHCMVFYEGVDRVPFDEGENRASKRRTYIYKLLFTLWDDVGVDQPALDLHQGLENIFGDSRVFFRDFVTDTEGNLPAKAGRVELDEDIIEAESKTKRTLEATVRITVGQIAPLKHVP